MWLVFDQNGLKHIQNNFKKVQKYIYNKTLFLEHLTHIFGFNYKTKNFIKVISRADRPLFGLVNTIKRLEIILKKISFTFSVFFKSYSLSHQNIQIMIIFFSNLQAYLYNLWKTINCIFCNCILTYKYINLGMIVIRIVFKYHLNSPHHPKKLKIFIIHSYNNEMKYNFVNRYSYSFILHFIFNKQWYDAYN